MKSTFRIKKGINIVLFCWNLPRHVSVSQQRVSKLMANLYQQSPCRHANRGCDRILTPANTLLHLQECAFAPVRCSHEGCQATVNRQDLISHQQTCEFRSVICDDCRETMGHREYENHICVLPRELSEVTRMLRQVSIVPNVAFYYFQDLDMLLLFAYHVRYVNHSA